MAERSHRHGSDSQAPHCYSAASSHCSTYGHETAHDDNSVTVKALSTMGRMIPGHSDDRVGLATRRIQTSQYLHTSPVHATAETYEPNETGGNYSSLAGDLHLGSLPPLYPQPTEATTTQRQDQAIYDFLRRGTDPNKILDYVENFKIMTLSGNFHDLAIMAEIPSEELTKRVENIAAYSRPAIAGDLPTIKREPLEERLDHSPTHATGSQGSKRAKMRDAVGATINKPPARVYGCLGDGARCQERKHRYWRSKKEFGIHFETHLGDYETPDGYKCPACEKRRLSPGIVSITTTSFSHGRDLAMHVWFKHMVPSTTPMQLQDTSLVVKDGLQEGSTGRQDQTCYSKQGSHFQNTIETGGNCDESWECSDTECGQPGVSELDLWAFNDGTYDADAASLT